MKNERNMNNWNPNEICTTENTLQIIATTDIQMNEFFITQASTTLVFLIKYNYNKGLKFLRIIN